MKKPPIQHPRRGDGQWLSYGIAGLMIVMLFSQLFEMAEWMFETFLADHLYRFEYAYVLIYPIFGLCCMTAFFATSLFLTFGSRWGLFSFIIRRRS